MYTVFALQISVVTFWYTPQKTNHGHPQIPIVFLWKILFQTIIFRVTSVTPTRVEVTTPGIRGHLPRGWRPMHLGFQTTGLGEHVDGGVGPHCGVSRCTWMHHLNSTKSTLAYEDSSPTFNKYTVMSRGILWGKRESPSPSTLDIWQW